MRLLVLIAASAVPASSAAVQPPTAVGTPVEVRDIPIAKDAKVTLPGQACPHDPQLRPVDGQAARVLDGTGATKLGELPPGNLQLAVMRRDLDGCVEPVIVRYGYGASADIPGAGNAQRW